MSRPVLRLGLVVIGWLMSASACVAMSSAADNQDACRIGVVSPEGYGTAAAMTAVNLLTSRTIQVQHGAETDKRSLVEDAAPLSEQPRGGEAVPQGALEPLDDGALRRALCAGAGATRVRLM